MSRQKIAAGNWKMNKTMEDGIALATAIKNDAVVSDGAQVILAPPSLFLQKVVEATSGHDSIAVAAQNCHQEEKGAYTGEISVGMLQSIGVSHVILGHSERREYFKESNQLLAAKVDRVLSAGLTPIFCCGESLAIRESGEHIAFVANQLQESLFHLTNEQFSNIIIAYEPIWAIGTGVTASKEQAQEMHHEIRGLISKQYGKDLAESTSILYGGSVKPANAKDLFDQPDVDGGLVGGASLKADDFLTIISTL